ncbi:hypothetical protein HC928_04400 [bacterium]|nr:hypothetical protein [bacterium]
MDRSFELHDFQAPSTSDATDFALFPERSYVPSHENTANDATNENLDGGEQDSPRLTSVNGLLKVEHWKPAEPQYCKEIAAHYGQSRRNIQKWFVNLREIAPWLSEAELRLSDDRYTPLAVELLGHRYFAGSKKKWETVLRELFADRVSASPKRDDVPVSPTEVMPTDSQHSARGDRLGGLTLHPGSSPAVPRIPSIVPPSDDTVYLTEIQQRLRAFEALQQQAIAQMQEQFQQAQALNTQYQEAISLSDQLLLQEFQLKGVQLGYTALELKHQAFKSTIQAAEAGTLPLPGKPPVPVDSPISG